jgi:hypothetical protein
MVIYQTINIINNKKYIGKDKNNNPKYLGSGTYLKKSIKKYGKLHFKKEIIEYCIDENHLKEREEYWLKYYDVANNPLFYNATNFSSGNTNITNKHKNIISKKNKNHQYNLGRTHSENTKQKISESNKGKTLTDDQRQKISLSKIGNKYALGNKLNKLQKQKISLSKTNHPCYLDLTRNEKISNKNKGLGLGMKKSDETKKRMSQNRSKPIMQYDSDMIFIKEWDSVKSINGNYNLILALKNNILYRESYWKYKNI